MSRGFWVGLVAIAVLALATPGAHAAKTVGSNLYHPADSSVCPLVLIPVTHSCTEAIAGLVPGDAATFGPVVPSAGVITAWRIKRGVGGFDVPIALRVIRDGTAVGTSNQEVLPGDPGVFSYPARLLTRPGDQIGVDLRQIPFGRSVAVAHEPANEHDLLDEWTPQLDTGASTPPDRDNADGIELLLQVEVEPDVDGDDYGDETQDACPAIATTQQLCETGAPDTTITKKPKRKTKKPKAKVSFTSTAADAAFQCSLDGLAYTPCSSPWKLKKLGEGAHFLFVRAVANQIPDPTPASAKFTVKKKKQKHR